MPRKPQPEQFFVIEKLSTGERLASLDIKDDFADAMIKPNIPQRVLARPLPGAEEIIRQRKAKEAKTKQAQLVHSAKTLHKVLSNMIDPPEHKPFKRRI